MLSFLRDTRELTSWTTRDLSKTLHISHTEASQALTVLHVQGYVKPLLSTPLPEDSKRLSKARSAGEWITTPQGQEVSGSRPPRYTRETVLRSLDSFADHLRRVNRDSSARYKVVTALAFGDFLSGRPRVQAADIGIRLEPRDRTPDEDEESAAGQNKRKAFLKQLRGKTASLNLHPYSDWMSLRTHRNLLSSR